MIGLILKQMNAMEIISPNKISLLRNHLKAEYPKISTAEIDQTISEYIIQIIDHHLDFFGEEYRQRLKSILIKNTMSHQPVEILGSDLLKAGLQLNAEEPFFRHELARWVSECPIENVSSEDVYDLLLKRLHPAENETVVALKKTDMEPDVSKLHVEAEKNSSNFSREDARHTPIHRFMDRLETLSKNCIEILATSKNLSIAIGLALILLLFCPLVLNNRTEAKEFATGADSDRTEKPDENPQSIVSPKSFKKDTLEKSVPIGEEPNALIVGFVRLKVANGLFEIPVKEIFERKIRARATAYDLSKKSCGKATDHPEYGITASGTRAVKGRTIAVDPSVIPLGTRVYIVFPEKYHKLNGLYVAEDTGKHVKGYKVDIFLGEDNEGEDLVRNAVNRFGVQKIEVFVLKKK
jgi:3D (Asp-Asp-Asp) domain-containing protein